VLLELLASSSITDAAVKSFDAAHVHDAYTAFMSAPYSRSRSFVDTRATVQCDDLATDESRLSPAEIPLAAGLLRIEYDPNLHKQYSSAYDSHPAGFRGPYGN